MMRAPFGVFAAASLGAAACQQSIVSNYDLPPQATIITPEEGFVSTLPSLQLAGSVDDNDVLETLQVEWASNLQEAPLFTGNPDTSGYVQFTATGLVSGLHTLTMKVTDSLGQTDVATVNVTVATDPPQVYINQPQAAFQYYTGAPVVFDGLVLTHEGLAGAFAVDWSSDLQGVLFTGSSDTFGVSHFETSLNAGTHLIMLRAVDGDGVAGSASVSITVDNVPLGELDQDSDGFCPDGIDQDGDGRCIGAENTGPGSQDCNDMNAAVCPICPEICDATPDNNCDGVLDPNDFDLDADGWSICQGDCDDAAPWNYPTNPEVCDGRDNDCSGLADFDVLGETDADGDGVRSCNDCNDQEPLAFPGNPEVCDNVDNNCNNQVDEGFDQDSDGYATCEGDCNDLNNAIHPNAAEICNTIDDDCDGYVNEDQAGPFEMWETSANSPGYQLNSIEPQLVFGTGTCSIGGFLRLQPGTGSVAGVFSSPQDLWDIYEFDTGLTSNIAAWLAFIASGQGLPASCQAGSITWTASQPIQVIAYIDGAVYAGSGSSGSIQFNLSIIQLFDIEYEIVVTPLATWSNCNYSYTLNFVIP
jgi:hypothetical protein